MECRAGGNVRNACAFEALHPLFRLGSHPFEITCRWRSQHTSQRLLQSFGQGCVRRGQERRRPLRTFLKIPEAPKHSHLLIPPPPVCIRTRWRRSTHEQAVVDRTRMFFLKEVRSRFSGVFSGFKIGAKAGSVAASSDATSREDAPPPTPSATSGR